MKNHPNTGRKFCSFLPVSFLFDPEKETLDNYLTRAAAWIDHVDRGTVEEKQEIRLQLGEQAGIMDLKNYIFTLMNEPLEKLARANYRKLVQENQYEEFLNEYRILVWNSFYRFNNPRYRKSEEKYCFTTFAMHYLKQAAWRVQLLQFGVTDYTYRNCKRIRWAEERLANADNVDMDAVTDEEIRALLSAEYEKDLSIANIRTLRNLMKPFASISDEYAEKTQAEESENEQEPDAGIMQDLEDFLSRYRALQVFIFLQNYGFCSKYYRELSVTTLAQDPFFLQLCRSDLKARKRIRTQKDFRTAPEEPEQEGESGNVQDNCIYLKEKYIFNIRMQIREEFTSYVQERNLTAYQLRKNLSPVMYRAWENLVLLYEINEK